MFGQEDEDFGSADSYLPCRGGWGGGVGGQGRGFLPSLVASLHGLWMEPPASYMPLWCGAVTVWQWQWADFTVTETDSGA